VNEVRISGTVENVSRLQAGSGVPRMRFDLRYEIESGVHRMEIVTPVRVPKDRAAEFAGLRHGDSVNIVGVLSGEKFRGRDNQARFATFVVALEITVEGRA
jgi:primosomal replication protein N